MSIETYITPSNIKCEEFQFSSRFNKIGNEQSSLVRAVKEYGQFCHIVGSNACCSWEGLKDIIESSGLSAELASFMVTLSQGWVAASLKRCDYESRNIGFDISDSALDETVIVSCLSWLACVHGRLLSNQQVERQPDNVLCVLKKL